MIFKNTNDQSYRISRYLTDPNNLKYYSNNRQASGNKIIFFSVLFLHRHLVDYHFNLESIS